MENEKKVEEVKEETSKTVTVATVKYGRPAKGCELLRLRKNASDKAEILTLIKSGSTFKIIESDSTNSFYKVNYSNIEGYCMKKFVEVFTIPSKTK